MILPPPKPYYKIHPPEGDVFYSMVLEKVLHIAKRCVELFPKKAKKSGKNHPHWKKQKNQERTTPISKYDMLANKKAKKAKISAIYHPHQNHTIKHIHQRWMCFIVWFWKKVLHLSWGWFILVLMKGNSEK